MMEDAEQVGRPSTVRVSFRRSLFRPEFSRAQCTIMILLRRHCPGSCIGFLLIELVVPAARLGGSGDVRLPNPEKTRSAFAADPPRRRCSSKIYRMVWDFGGKFAAQGLGCPTRPLVGGLHIRRGGRSGPVEYSSVVHWKYRCRHVGAGILILVTTVLKVRTKKGHGNI